MTSIPARLACPLVALLSGGCALTPETRAEETAYQVLALSDATQTLSIADHPLSMHETNPMFGQHPQPNRVAASFAVTSVSHFAITYVLTKIDAPPWLVRTWEFSGIALEAGCVGNNLEHGIRPTLSFHVVVGAPPHQQSPPSPAWGGG